MRKFLILSAIAITGGLLFSACGAVAQTPAPAAAAPNPLGSLARNDRNSDGKVSAEEFASTRVGIKKLDKNGDKAASTEEVTAFYVAIAPLEDSKTKSRINSIMSSDANKDGKVTEEEMAAGILADFKKRDKNGDGFITGDER